MQPETIPAEDPRPNSTPSLAALLAQRYRHTSADAALHPLHKDLQAYADWIGEAHRLFREATQSELSLTYASEWVLDNFYIIRQSLEQIEEDLPPGYLRRLPRLDERVQGDDPFAGFPRMYAIVRRILLESGFLLNISQIQSILIELQNELPLTMGELWAVPIFLRYVEIETLAYALEDIIRPAKPPALPRRVLQDPSSGQAAEPATLVANAILSLRAISDQSWLDFFEAVSRVEALLRDDPAGVYARMDFNTRDSYRKQIEDLAHDSGREEGELAALAVALARQTTPEPGLPPTEQEQQPEIDERGVPEVTAVHEAPLLEDRRAHVGYFLVDAGRPQLEAQIGYRPSGFAALRRWLRSGPPAAYLGAVGLISALLLALVLARITALAMPWWLLAAAALLSLIPALTIATHLVNWLVTLLLKPRRLPKVSFRAEIPEQFHTLVVIPAMISSRDDVDDLAGQIQMHYLRNSEPGLSFALLTDYPDADVAERPGDDELLEAAFAAIERLNRAYPREEQPRFYLFHRRRQWNPSEGVFMGWERKRGKLHELNRLLLDQGGGEPELNFLQVERAGIPRGVRFVITLDADTILPGGAARRLAGTLAHPLNRPLFDPQGRVVTGYTILQPRVEISPSSAGRSWFTRIFSGDTGLDLYTRAVSDAYQDFLGEGIFVGKGIYDVAAFAQSVNNRIPENAILSHDLLEGLMGRAGLVSDITLIEDYPPNFFVSVTRQQRWIRGDWQLLPWLFTRRHGGLFSAMDRWKMFDNLRRSLLAPALVLLFVGGLLLLPELDGLWTLILLVTLGVPLLTSLAGGLRGLLAGGLESVRANIRATARSAAWSFLRWLPAVAFLPYEAFHDVQAIGITLYRLWISRRNLLQWTTAAASINAFMARSRPGLQWLRILPVALVGLALAAWLALRQPAALYPALPVLLLWIAAPLLVHALNLPVQRGPLAPLDDSDNALLRRVARRTWAFFERYVGPEDHWLPPDHYQEHPVGMVAHRTSPTNIGLLLNATQSAYDLGYIDPLVLVTRLVATFETLARLERFRGHFLNWYDTVTLQPLTPRYVSTVDSGNLAASLIVVAQGCRALPNAPIFGWQLWQGYLDTLSIFEETLSGLRDSQLTRPTGVTALESELTDQIAAMRGRILAVQGETSQWYGLFRQIVDELAPQFAARLGRLVSTGGAMFDVESLRALQQIAQQLERQHMAIQRIIDELTPWVALVQQGQPGRDALSAAELAELRETLPNNPTLLQIRQNAGRALELVERLRKNHPGSSGWFNQLAQAIMRGQSTAGVLINTCADLAEQAQRYAAEMDFRFLFHRQRRIFHIGFNLESNQLDANYYDLLASEARIASLVAIAHGQVPLAHWLQLSRPVTQVNGQRVLLSWSATMFEYLMPPLFFRRYPNTLLAESAAGAVAAQIAYAAQKNAPWGISESGFYLFDPGQSYQYRAFGVPGLGFKRGLADDLVIAPYASLMAVSIDPPAVAANAKRLQALNMQGLYGFYEALDLTPERMAVGESAARVREYMAHHQGMILLALNNYFNADIMVERMHADPFIRSIELLLQEQVPLDAPLKDPFAEDVKGVQRLAPAPVEISPWSVPVGTPTPQAHLLSNNTYSVLITNSGSGYSTWNGLDLTRWQPDGVLDQTGCWIYLQDADDPAAPWSAASQPAASTPDAVQVTFFAHMAVFRREERGVVSTLEVTVSPSDPVEIRRLHLANPGERARRLRATSYGEVILAAQANDARHPAFNKLFIESEFLPELGLQIFKRRPRSAHEQPVFLGHLLVVRPSTLPGADEPPRITSEGDRRAFIERHGSPRAPRALVHDEWLSGSTGATLDPIFALGLPVELPAHRSLQIAYLTLAGTSREEIVALAERYRDWLSIERAFQQSDIAAQSWLGQQNMDTAAVQNTLRALSALIYPHKATRAPADVLAANRLGQPGLWRFGVSDDYPILLVEIDDPQQLELVREALLVHRYLRSRRFLADVVILNHQQTNYGAELNGMLYRLIARANSEQWLNQRGGVFILYRDQLPDEEYTLMRSAARLTLNGQHGPLAEQLPGYSIQVPHLPDFQPTRAPSAEPALPAGAPLEAGQFANGFGAFVDDEYVIELQPGQPTPAPWVNVIGYPQFGFLVTEAGSMTTWAGNSGENRLTPWSNDPVRDPSGEATYLRDEETGEVWTPTPLPAGAGVPFRVRHGAGYSVFQHVSHGLEHTLTVYASPDDPLKIIRLDLTNPSERARRLSITQYVEWVLGVNHAASMPFILPEFDPASATLLATNPYNREFASATAFLAASHPLHGLTADRVEFLGRGGTLRSPAALQRIGLETRIEPGEDPCAVLQVALDLAPGASESVYFLLGQAGDRAAALELVQRYREPGQIEAAWQRAAETWDHLLGTLQVQTPDPAVDLMVNRWLLYQAVSCRLWGRSAFYQSSGAYGFRDQLQDVLALCAIDPPAARGQILLAAAHQFEEGDVLHWWHPPSGRGTRTRFSDDLLWLPYVTAHYIETTGDTAILDERAPFRVGPALREGEDERYGEFGLTAQTYPLLEHCRRAIERGATSGAHGLPLMGSGDWNDGMNRVGEGGQGESVWLAWFLIDTLQRFASVLEKLDAPLYAAQASAYRERAERYAAAIEQHAWDGAWYRRAYYDDGTPLGSARSDECQIDAIAQSWAVLSGAGQPQRAQRAMQSVLERLVREEDRLILLFTPPFDQTDHDPGYIKGYLPGIRENGGQYTHAAIWSAWAMAKLGDREAAGRLFGLLNPILQSADRQMAEQYRVEPYVVAADVYSVEPYTRRGGWTWYTGSASWFYRLGVEALLGIRKIGNTLEIRPTLPAGWQGYRFTYRHGSARYTVQVNDVGSGATARVELVDDGQTHELTVEV